MSMLTVMSWTLHIIGALRLPFLRHLHDITNHVASGTTPKHLIPLIRI